MLLYDPPLSGYRTFLSEAIDQTLLLLLVFESDPGTKAIKSMSFLDIGMNYLKKNGSNE